MQFRLVYQGKLPAAGGSGTRNQEKHAIRKVLHKQLGQLWQCQPILSRYLIADSPNNRSGAEMMADKFERCGFRFLPLFGDYFGSLACALDILFLRRDQPGDLIKYGGDIDNRIKVLFDALRMPQECQELDGQKPGEDENPFFCLLQDDRQITEVNITTDRLLTPQTTDENINDVHLIIHVKTLSLDGNTFTAFLT
jgi:hypothetical protein